MKVPPGYYDMVIYNYNTESVLIRGDGAFETIEAYTDRVQGLVPVKDGVVTGPFVCSKCERYENRKE